MKLLLMVLGVVYLLRRPSYTRLRPELFPGRPADQILEWRRLELRSIDIFLWATFGSEVLGLLMLALTGPQSANSDAAMIPMVVVVVLFLGGLVWSANVGSLAKSLREQIGLTTSEVKQALRSV